jgi:SpoVK/Ycf46/Vps4 family AAA+-type ATPase
MKLIPKLIKAALDKDLKSIRTISSLIAREFKVSNPDIAYEILSALDANGVGLNTRSFKDVIKSDTLLDINSSLFSEMEPLEIDMPILDSVNENLIKEFLEERSSLEILLKNSLFPTSSIIISGPPGVGKTQIAKYLSGKLNLNLVTIDLASSISSLFGKTGQNIKSVFEYAKNKPCLLLLDEFDAIGKKRDDSSDLGELKRIVNVILKEMEDWPYSSILFAATNHPELLDKAIWRRFDLTLRIDSPDYILRTKIVEYYLKEHELLNIFNDFIPIICDLTEGMSGSDIELLIQRIKKKSILTNFTPIQIIYMNMMISNNKNEVAFLKLISRTLKKRTNLSMSKIGELLGKPKSTIQYYLRDK